MRKVILHLVLESQVYIWVPLDLPFYFRVYERLKEVLSFLDLKLVSSFEQGIIIVALAMKNFTLGSQESTVIVDGMLMKVERKDRRVSEIMCGTIFQIIQF
eukprot:TRINITY_DN25056_c0_g1_i10.p4 TRINITY_DN25056_c0_g1~~TRINITY_DN25056_c0_g1_i10.p4  ORF type:complete len:101 (+),score=8.62 TRINITY_DN25056_c0_g1_i10:180-482(+)